MTDFRNFRIPDLAGKRVLVTGASTGIGAAVAEAFGAMGSHVAVHFNRSEAEAKRVKDVIDGSGGTAHLVKGDVATSAGAAAVVGEAAGLLGGLDVLINNAGGMVRRSPLGEIDDAVFDRVVDLNVRSVVAACREAAGHLAASKQGVIVNTTSVAARLGGGTGATLYASSKAFVTNFTRGLAKELSGAGIRVNAVAPGVIDTPFHPSATSQDMFRSIERTTPLKRVGTPEDCVGAFLFLASPALSGYVTGHTVEVNGGLFMA